jgi:hypothetical protein
MDMSDWRKPADRSNEDEAPLPERILAAAREHHAPPPTPREEIWLRIQAARNKSAPSVDVIPIDSRRPRQNVSRWLALGAGIAALLALGIGLGRMTSAPESGNGPVVLSAAPGDSAAASRSAVAYTVATTQHLSRVETFLTTLRHSPEVDSSFTLRARDLLSSTRLLQDAPALDPRLRRLLSDLEDILVQVAQFDRSRGAEELDLITDGLKERQVLPRIRSAVPAGPARAL